MYRLSLKNPLYDLIVTFCCADIRLSYDKGSVLCDGCLGYKLSPLMEYVKSDCSILDVNLKIAHMESQDKFFNLGHRMQNKFSQLSFLYYKIIVC